MRVSVDGFDTLIEGEVIDGQLLDGRSGGFDLDSAFTVRCDDGVSFRIHGWMVQVEILAEPAERAL